MGFELPVVQEFEELRDRHHGRFESTVETVEYDSSGMWYSEIFIFTLMCEYLDCNRIFESGRARGVSTELLATYFEGSDIEICSIDDRPRSEDAKIAESKLNDFENVSLKYGDSTELLPENVTTDTGVLIDGPKGDAALKLAAELLDSNEVPLVAIHDLNKDVFHRDLSELLFNNNLYTDDPELVDAFRSYDQPVHDWNEAHHTENNKFGPYLKNGEKSHSYGPTLGLFFGDDGPVDTRVKENYYEYLGRDTTALVGELLERQQETGGPIRRRVAGVGLKLGRDIV